MIKNIKQHLITMKYWLGRISEHNNHTTKITENLRMAVLNLKIQQANLGNNAKGILPITNLIERSILELHDSTKELTDSGRTALIESYEQIQQYIDNNEFENNKN